MNSRGRVLGSFSRRGRVIVIPGVKNKLAAFAVRLAPRILVRKLVKRLQG